MVPFLERIVDKITIDAFLKIRGFKEEQIPVIKEIIRKAHPETRLSIYCKRELFDRSQPYQLNGYVRRFYSRSQNKEKNLDIGKLSMESELGVLPKGANLFLDFEDRNGNEYKINLREIVGCVICRE